MLRIRSGPDPDIFFTFCAEKYYEYRKTPFQLIKKGLKTIIMQKILLKKLGTRTQLI
jgi:hypothetical protein